MTADTASCLPAADAAAARYLRSLRQGTNPCRADGDLETQAANYARATERNELRAAQARQILLALGVPRVQHLAYRRFCLHLDRLSRTCSGRTLTIQAELALARWSASGLDPAILAALCREIFGLNHG